MHPKWSYTKDKMTDQRKSIMGFAGIWDFRSTEILYQVAINPTSLRLLLGVASVLDI